VAAARIVSLASAALQLPVLTRSLAPETYGIVAIVMVLSTYFALVAAEPATLAFQRHPGADDARRNYSYALGRVVPAIGAVAALMLIVAAVTGDVAAALAVAAWGAGLAIARLTATAWLMWGRNWSYAGNLMASTTVRTGVLVGLVLGGVDGVVAVTVAGAAAAVAGLALSPRFAPRGAFLGESPWPRRLGYLLAAASLGVTVLTSANMVVLQGWVGPAGAASFAAMSQLSTLTCAAVVSLLLTALYPRVRRDWDAGHRDAVRSRLQTTQLLMLTVGAACVAALTAFDGLAAKIVVAPRLVDVPVLVLLTTAATLAGLGQASGWFLQLELRARSLAVRTAVAAGVTITLTVVSLLTPLPPDQGVALATLLGFAAYFFATTGRRAAQAPLVPSLASLLCVGAAANVSAPAATTSIAATIVTVCCAALTFLSIRRTT